MPAAVIDACCLIDLLASGQAEAILRAAGLDWYVPTAVEGEVQRVRQHDPANPGQFVMVSVDLSALKAAGVLQTCAPESQSEQDGYVQYATLFRSAGEAMCIAIAEQRGWAIATDDRKAIRISRQAKLTVVSCPALVKAWADSTGPDQAAVLEVLQNIQVLAQFKPNASMPEYQWWVDQFGP
jgi:hypothetical protein